MCSIHLNSINILYPFMFSSSLKGYLQVATASILFGLIGIFITLITQMPLPSIIFYRLLIGLGGIILFLVCCSKLNELRLNKKKALPLPAGFISGDHHALLFLLS